MNHPNEELEDMLQFTGAYGGCSCATGGELCSWCEDERRNDVSADSQGTPSGRTGSDWRTTKRGPGEEILPPTADLKTVVECAVAAYIMRTVAMQ
jgi:hypothetical protein